MTEEAGSASKAQRYRVGDLLLDVGQKRAWRDDVEVRLPKLSFDLLLMLVRAAPNLVSNDELMEGVWPGIVVSPETVSQRVKLLRGALGDDAHEPRYFAVSRGQGCRLLAPVSQLNDEAAPLRAVDPTVVTQGRPGRSSRYIASVIIALSAITVTVFVLRGHHATPLTARVSDSKTLVALPARTVAVLPFENLSVESGKDDHPGLGLGIAEMVISRLSETPELLVIARSSSFAYLGRNIDAREIGRQLNARLLVEGSVQREGQRLRVTAQLVDAETGRQVKAMHFDRDLTDVFRLQDEISEQIASELDVNIDSGRGPVHNSRTTSANLDAYLMYLQGRALLDHWRVADARAAAELLARALEIDPSFAPTYAELAHAKWQATYLAGEDTSQIFESASRLIRTALSLDNRLGEAYVMRAQLEIERDPSAAEADFRKGLELSPNYAVGYGLFGDALASNDRPKEALEMIERARRLDPRAPRYSYLEAQLFFFRGDPQSERQGEALMLHTLEIDPTFSPAFARMAEYKWLGERGETAEALKLIERALQLDPVTEWLQVRACDLYLDLGEVAAARQVLSQRGIDPTGHISVALYERDWARAGELALRRGEGFHEWEFLPVYAVRAYAVHTGELRRSIQFLRSMYHLEDGATLRGPIDCYAAYSLVFLLRRSGQASLADRIPDLPPETRSPFDEIAHALMWIARGRRDDALAALTRFSDSGRHFPYWWTIEQDSMWDAVRGDPRSDRLRG